MNEERTELVNLSTFLAVSCTSGAALLHFFDPSVSDPGTCFCTALERRHANADCSGAVEGPTLRPLIKSCRFKRFLFTSQKKRNQRNTFQVIA